MQDSAFGVMVKAADAVSAREQNNLSGSHGPRALWPILGKPMIGYLLKTILESGAENVSVAVSSEDHLTCEYLKSFPSVAVLKLNSPEYGEWEKRFPGALLLDCGLPFLKAETVRSLMCGGDAERKAALSGEDARAVHDMAGLARASARMRDDIVLKWMENDVMVMDPNAVWIGPDVTLEPGVSVMPGAQLWGSTSVGAGSVVGPYCILRNTVIGRGVNLIANVIVDDSEFKDDTKAGPFAYIREGSVLEEHSLAGKFVEIKKTSVGRGSKVPHLSYMGDAILGEDVNIGAGSVTCNYDGTNKFQTRIGNRCFVGSDTMMVAPVTLGDDAATGAGSTITEDVPAGALALGRARQVNLEGRALRKKQVKTQ